MSTTAAPFLACYDYGQGGVWLLIDAPNEEGAQAAYPFLAYFKSQPPWMSETESTQLRADLEAKGYRWSAHAEPSGWLLRAAEEQPSPALPAVVSSTLEPVVAVLHRNGYKLVHVHVSQSFGNFFATFSKQGSALTVTRDRGQFLISGSSNSELEANGLWRAFSGPAPIAAALQKWFGSSDA